jgi:hypothetical protein
MVFMFVANTVTKNTPQAEIFHSIPVTLGSPEAS